MVLSYHGRATRVAELREQLTVGRDGASALALANAARGLGLRVKAFSVEPPRSAACRCRPSSTGSSTTSWWSSAGRSTPSRSSTRPAGRRTLTPEEFSAGFTGIVLVLEPGVNFERRRTAGRTGWRAYIGQYARNLRGMALAILGASLLLQLLGLVLPLLHPHPGRRGHPVQRRVPAAPSSAWAPRCCC